MQPREKRPWRTQEGDLSRAGSWGPGVISLHLCTSEQKQALVPMHAPFPSLFTEGLATQPHSCEGFPWLCYNLMTFTLGSSFPVDVTVTAFNPMLPVSFEPPVAAPSLARGRGTRLRHES